jgi:mannose-6-phosphate isomerase class I
LQYLNAVLQIKPELVYALNDYEFLDLLKSVSNLVNDKLIKTKTEYDDIIKKLEQAQAEQQEMQAQLAKAQYLNAMGSADKNANEAKQIATMG